MCEEELYIIVSPDVRQTQNEQQFWWRYESDHRPWLHHSQGRDPSPTDIFPGRKSHLPRHPCDLLRAKASGHRPLGWGVRFRKRTQAYEKRGTQPERFVFAYPAGLISASGSDSHSWPKGKVVGQYPCGGDTQASLAGTCIPVSGSLNPPTIERYTQRRVHQTAA